MNTNIIKDIVTPKTSTTKFGFTAATLTELQKQFLKYSATTELVYVKTKMSKSKNTNSFKRNSQIVISEYLKSKLQYNMCMIVPVTIPSDGVEQSYISMIYNPSEDTLKFPNSRAKYKALKFTDKSNHRVLPRTSDSKDFGLLNSMFDLEKDLSETNSTEYLFEIVPIEDYPQYGMFKQFDESVKSKTSIFDKMETMTIQFEQK